MTDHQGWPSRTHDNLLTDHEVKMLRLMIGPGSAIATQWPNVAWVVSILIDERNRLIDDLEALEARYTELRDNFAKETLNSYDQGKDDGSRDARGKGVRGV